MTVVNKPAGMVVHPGAGNPARTLQNALLALDPKLALVPRAGLVHRLDTTRSFIACEHPGQSHVGQFLICRTCGTVVETEDKRIAKATEHLGERHGYVLDQQTVELTGICGTCRKGGSGSGNKGMATRA